ncbi:MAG: hypothetical protein ACAI43_19635, partial [Phycisphaerae bacterium]
MLTVNAPSGVMLRSAEAPSGGATGAVLVSWTDNSNNEDHFKVVRQDTVTGLSVTAQITAPDVTSFFDTTVVKGRRYSYVVSAYNSSETSTGTTAADAWDWGLAHVGTGTTGSTSVSGGTTTNLTTSGAGMGGTADAFSMSHRSLVGNGYVIARVHSASDGNASALAGVVIRDSLAAGAKGVFLGVAGDGSGAVFKSRTSDNGSASSTNVSSSSGKTWVMLVREGSTLTGYVSADGATWAQAAQVTVSMGTTVYLGLAATAHGSGSTNAVAFRDVRAANSTEAAVDLTASAQADGGVGLRWVDDAGSEEGFRVYRSTDGTTFSTLANVGRDVDRYHDATAAGGTLYYYKVAALRGGSPGTASNVATATGP